MSASINKVILIGLVGDVASGGTWAMVRLATTNSWKDKDDEWQKKTTWHTIFFRGKTAERVAATIKKGVHLYVEGSYENNKDEARANEMHLAAFLYRDLTPKEKEATTQTATAEDEDYLPF